MFMKEVQYSVAEVITWLFGRTVEQRNSLFQVVQINNLNVDVIGNGFPWG